VLGPLLFHVVGTIAFESQGFLLGLLITLLGAAAGAWAAGRRAVAESSGAGGDASVSPQ